MSNPDAFWNARYGEPGFAYGTAPNEWLVEMADRLTGRVLCLASGEGRNAVWLAEQGLDVTAVDASAVGVAKTLNLAKARGVVVKAETGNLATWDLGEDRWHTIVAIFAHLPPPVRRRVHAAIGPALCTGGHAVLEYYTPRQLRFRTGGPPNIELLVEPGAVRAELEGLEVLRCDEVERERNEGKYHNGRASVVQVLARRPH